MPTQGTAKAKAKPAAAANRSTTANPAAPPTIITVTKGEPDKAVAYVNVGGTAQFDNRDSVDYRLRLWGVDHNRHAAVDVLLPALGSVTVMTDPLSAPNDETPYDLLPTNVQNPTKGAKPDGAGGGRIIIGPGPAAAKKSR
jgi:hypothetical protein